MQTEVTGATRPILVTGGTGTLGRLVVAGLLERGRSVRVLSRGRLGAIETRAEYVRADLASGEGVDAAVAGAETIVHTAGSAKGDEQKARSLVSAASAAGARHVVYISVVGADRLPIASAIDRAMFGYFAAKRAAEQAVADSGIPWTSLRATQFHELTLKTVRAMTAMPVVPVPKGWHLQPIAAAEVADRLVELALGPPAGLVAEMGGPRIHAMVDLVRSYLDATDRNRKVVQLPLPGEANRAFRGGANLAPERAVGRQTWEEFLSGRRQPLDSRRAA